jgi:hypothetical protein
MTEQTRATDMRFTSLVSTTRIKFILKLIESAPHGLTYSQLSESTDMHYRTLQEYIAYMHKQAHVIHIGGWILPEEGKAIKVFKVGNKPDVPCVNVHAKDECFLNRHPLHVPRNSADAEILPVRRVAKNIKPHADTFPVAAAFFGRLAA